MNQARLELFSFFFTESIFRRVQCPASDVLSNRQHRLSANTLASVLLSPKVKDRQSSAMVSALMGACTLASVFFSPKIKDCYSLETVSAR